MRPAGSQFSHLRETLPGFHAHQEGRQPQAETGFRVVEQPEMDDYLASGEIRSTAGQIHVSDSVNSQYAGARNPTGPQYVVEVDLTRDKWDTKIHGGMSEAKVGAVNRAGSIPLDRAKAIYGFQNKRMLMQALGEAD